MGYSLVFLAKGDLPWQKVEAKTKTEKYLKVKNIKQSTSIEGLCKGLPIEFVKYITYVRALKFEERPNYSYIQTLFKKCAYSQKSNTNIEYEWAKLDITSKSIEIKDSLSEWTREELINANSYLSDYKYSQNYEGRQRNRSVDYSNNNQESGLQSFLQVNNGEVTRNSVGYSNSRKKSQKSLDEKKLYTPAIVQTSWKYINNLFQSKQKEYIDRWFLESEEHNEIKDAEENEFISLDFGEKKMITSLISGDCYSVTKPDLSNKSGNCYTIKQWNHPKPSEDQKKNFMTPDLLNSDNNFEFTLRKNNATLLPESEKIMESGKNGFDFPAEDIQEISPGNVIC